MNFGKTIYALRKKKNVTQDEMAAELGVTAAAVSKWENGYTLPDILMLCALADYFDVTTDELLGRHTNWKYAVIAAQTRELGKKMEALAKQYGIFTKAIYEQYPEAVAAAKADSTVSYLLVGYRETLKEEDWEEDISNLYMCQCIYQDDQQLLDSFELMLKKFTA